MSRIPQSFIDELMARADIVEVVDECVPLRKQGSNFKACCPFHEERTPSFNVSADRQIYHCFGCGAGGNVLGFLMEYEHLSFPEAVRSLAGRYGMAMPEAREEIPAPIEGRRKGPGRDVPTLQQLNEQAARFFEFQLRNHPEAEAAHRYLRGRGVSGKTAARFRLGLAPTGWRNLLEAMGTDPARRQALEEVGLIVDRGPSAYDRFRNRLIFPIRDRRGRVVAFGGRVMDGAEPKYLNSPEGPLFQKGQELYGLYEARQAIRREQQALVVEGYMDVIALAEAGIANAVAPLGTALTEDQLRLLLRAASEVVLAFDGDDAGRKAAWRSVSTALPEMGRGRAVSFLFLPEGEDPDSLVRAEGPEGFRARAEKKATPLFEFLIQGLKEQVTLSAPEGRDRLLELAGPLFGRLRDAKLRDLLVQRLDALVKLGPGRVAQHLERVQGRERAARSGEPSDAHHATQLLANQPIIRQALLLLLDDPQEFAKEVLAFAEELKRYRSVGIDLLLAIAEVVHAEPDIGVGTLIERLRGIPNGDVLARIAGQGSGIPPEGRRMQLRGCLRKLQAHTIKARLDDLEEKARVGTWTVEQAQEFQNLKRQQQRLERMDSSAMGPATST